MATENKQSARGVRTYRGRTLQEILPQIREELGSDAIILREREGLVGGVRGFFAQRFIEVDARRGDGQSIDIYDDGTEDDFSLGLPADDGAAEPPSLAPPAAETELAALSAGPAPPVEESTGREQPTEPEQFTEPDQPTEREQPLLPAAEAPAERPQPRPFIPPVVQGERNGLAPPEPEPRALAEPQALPEPEAAPKPKALPEPQEPPKVPPSPSRAFETDVFLERLRAASQMLPDDDEEEDEARVPPPAAREPRLRPPAPLEQRQAPPARERGPRPPARESSEPRSSPRAGAPPRSPRAAGSAEPASSPPSANPYESVRQRPPSLHAGLSAPAAPAAPTAPTARAAPARSSAPVAPSLRLPSSATLRAQLPVSGDRPAGGGLIRQLIARLMGGRFGGAAQLQPSRPHPIDAVAAAQITTWLSGRGASHAFASELLATAGAHGSPLAGGSLRAAAQAEVARRIVSPPPLPATGAAVAFIGAGGAGKTRCTAALASAYSRSSTLGVTVLALGDRGDAQELRRLLATDRVPVLSLNGQRAAQAVAAARQGGIVIIDTPTTTPTDPSALEGLARMLAPLELDATYVTLPATLGAQAARRALAGFGQLGPTAVAITHADESDQLGVIVELAIAHRVPLAYVHTGADPQSALSAVSAATLAQELLAQ